mgnify:CR=1 FL=1
MATRPIVYDLPPDRVHQQHFTGTQSILFNDFGSVNIQHPHLRGKDQLIVLSDHIPGGPQAVAVQHRPHHISVGK